MTEQQTLQLQYQFFLHSPSLLKENPSDDVHLFSLKASAGITEELQLSGKLVFGKRMERFFSQYIQSSADYSLLAENLQVIKDNLTIGELDFLMRELHTGKILHLELAFKFYLYLPDEADASLKWAGPNRRDFLSKKLEKLRVKQFPLLYKPETQPFLKSLGIEAEDIEQRLCLQGLLFLPLSWEGKVPSEVNSSAIKGWWIHSSEFTKEIFGSARFSIPEKENWILHPQHASEWVTFQEAEEAMVPKLEAQKSLMCWIKTGEGKMERIFVVWW